jgi:putative redox protein
MKPITVTWDGGVRFTADIRGHKVAVDQPVKAGGSDSAPTPLELVPAALGTCVAYFVQQFLTARGLDPAGMSVEVRSTDAPAPHRIGRFDVEVRIPGGVPDKYREAVRRAAETCTVHHTLTHHPEVSVSMAPSMAGAVGG